ncbi:MAG: type I DNA topoisomerase [Anaerolineae bacterium]|nr:type I DNA topoisomerase [Anaerolineales bacterium]MCQ3972014.1 type I DNA topoisomerase [Anaerolineae bacterium]
MPTKLLIVESSKKARTIKGMLGPDFTVTATSGHILEMPVDGLHVDLQNFTPTLYLMRGKGQKVDGLRQAAATAEMIYLATDLDREGEAIAQHVAERLGRSAAGKVRRITFTAITEADLRAALASPRSIDRRLVEAQMARRVTDRLVGYMVSPILWQGLSGMKRLSAGRVQSPALWLVVERERAIQSFVAEEWWSIEAELSKQRSEEARRQGGEVADEKVIKFWASLFKIKGKKPELKTQADAEKVLADLKGADWRVQRVEKGTRLRYPYPPFTTDSMQQAASSQLGFNPRLTMKLAQELYEGLKLGEGKAVGLITYIRTDSVAVAPEAQQTARAVVSKFFGESYLPPQPPTYQTRDKTAQEAHEAIRPVDPWKTPKAIEPYLTPQQYQLYRLIWRRFIASQMKPALYDTVTVDIETMIEASPTIYLFRATGSTLRFAGFLKVYGVDADAEEGRRRGEARRRGGEEAKSSGAGEQEGEGAENEVMPDLVVEDLLDLYQLIPKQHFTQPPQRYTEAQLIGALKKLGLGRPSTYATIVETLKERNYAAIEQKRLYPTSLGFQVCELLEKHIQMVVDVGFTAQMEEDLDRIARGEADRLTVMREFYGPFKTKVDQAMTAAAAERKPAAREAKRGEAKRPGTGKAKALPKSEKEGQACPQCQEGKLVVKSGKFGPFLGCSRYALGCHYTENIPGAGGRKKRGPRRKKKG